MRHGHTTPIGAMAAVGRVNLRRTVDRKEHDAERAEDAGSTPPAEVIANRSVG
jgi:hypothetical protein